MKKVFKALLFIAVISFSSCTKDQVLDVNVPQKSPFEKDLELVATKAGALSGVTLQPYWGKRELTPVFPKPVHVDSLGPGPGPEPGPGPTPGPTPEEEFNADLEYFVEVVSPVLEKHHAMEEFVEQLPEKMQLLSEEQNSEINLESFLESCNVDGSFDLMKFVWGTTSRAFQNIYNSLFQKNPKSYSVSEIAANSDLNKFEKIMLAYYLGYNAVNDINSYLSGEDVGTKGTYSPTLYAYCNIRFNNAMYWCETNKASVKFAGKFGIYGLGGTLSYLCGLGEAEALLWGLGYDFFVGANDESLFGWIEEMYQNCYYEALGDMVSCLNPPSNPPIK